MIRMFNKKGDVAFRSVMFAFVKFIIVILVLVTLMTFIWKFVYFEADTTELEAELFVNQLMRSPQGPSYFDPQTERLYPFVVDLSFFREENHLKKAFNFSDDFISAKISLYDSEGRPAIDGEHIEPVFFNKDKYNVWDDIANLNLKGQTGPGDIADFSNKYYVTIRDNDKTYAGFIKISVLMTKS